MKQWQTLGSLYSAYCNTISPGSYLHSQVSLKACLSSAKKNERIAEQARSQDPAAFSSARAKEYGAKAAMVATAVFSVVDALMGTGTHSAGKVKLSTAKDLKAHAIEIIKSPTETGLAGLITGLNFAIPTGFGALLGLAVGLTGAAVGATYNAINKKGFQVESPIISNCAGVGALLGATIGTLAYLGALPLVFGTLTIGIARVATGLAKAALAGCFYGAGYGVGLGFAYLQKPSI